MKDYDAIMKRYAKIPCRPSMEEADCNTCDERARCKVIMDAKESGLNITKLLAELDAFDEESKTATKSRWFPACMHRPELKPSQQPTAR